MKYYIEREALNSFFDREIRLYENCPDKYDAAIELKGAALGIPAADVRPVVRSRWKYIEYYPEGHDYKCQKCRYKNAEPTNYCPSCGAVMMGAEA